MQTEIKYVNAFNSIPGVGPGTLHTLKNYFGSYENAWRAETAVFKQIPLQEKVVQAIEWKRPSLHPDRELEKLIKENMWLATPDDHGFPESLKEIPHPPALIYGKGTPPWASAGIVPDRSVAIVGTRKPTAYGLETLGSIIHDLVQANIYIVSGLAFGIDTRAHETTVEAQGKTIGVLGSGLDRESIYPQQNCGLAERMIKSGGAILSEYAPGTPPLKEHFPQRNRIISGLSKGILVVEARERSGALITARLALEQGRDVFAIPGSIFSSPSLGPNKLIQEGAKLVLDAGDILEEIGIEYTKGDAKEPTDIDEHSQKLLRLLEEPLGVDMLKQKTGLDTAIIVSSLSLLELKGLVRNFGSGTYQKIN